MRIGRDITVWAKPWKACVTKVSSSSAREWRFTIFAISAPQEGKGRPCRKHHHRGIVCVLADETSRCSYVVSFDEALKEAAGASPETRQQTMSAVMGRSDTRETHPSLEHILPMHVAAGAAGSDRGERLWTLAEGSLSWAQYRFGKVAAA